MTRTIIVNGYKMNVNDDDVVQYETEYNTIYDDNIIKYETEYNVIPAPTKHYSVSFNESITTNPTSYTAPDGTIFTNDNETVTLTEVDTEM